MLTGSTTPGESRPGINRNERVLHIPPNSRTGVSLLDAIHYHTQDTFGEGGDLTSFVRDAVVIFWALLKG